MTILNRLARFDLHSVPATEPDGTVNGLDHKKSIEMNLKTGALKLATAPLTPLLPMLALPRAKDAEHVVVIAAEAVAAPVLWSLIGLKDLVVDVPLHAAALLLGKS